MKTSKTKTEDRTPVEPLIDQSELQGAGITREKIRCALAEDPHGRKHYESRIVGTWLPVWKKETAALRSGFEGWARSGGPCPVELLNRSIIWAWSYPGYLGEIGMDRLDLRKRPDPETAAANVQKAAALRRAFGDESELTEAEIAQQVEDEMNRELPVVEAWTLIEHGLLMAGRTLARAAADVEGVTPAAIENGLAALRSAYAPSPSRDGTESGAEYPNANDALWPDCMSGTDWDKLKEPGKSDLIRLRDALVALNHSTSKAAGKTVDDKPKEDPQPDGGAAVLRTGFILDPRDTPGALGDILREIKINNPDGMQILNLRKERTKSGKPLSWRKIAKVFERDGKPGHEYTGERVRQIHNEMIDKYPLLAGWVLGRMDRADIEDGPESDEDAIRSITGQSSFDERDLTDTAHNRAAGNNTGFTTTNNPRKPGYLANRKA